MNAYSRFTRRELNPSSEDGCASECLSLVKIDGETFYSELLDAESPFAVQITSGPAVGDDFVGLYDLDGDQISRSGITWDLVRVEDVPAELVGWETSWETGDYVIEPVAA